MIYLVSGWPGAGKSTISVQHAIDRYASEGRRVAANFPIDFAPVTSKRSSPLSRASCYVLPDRPSATDLDRLGPGNVELGLSDNMREERAGLLIIDEAGGWLNARTWQGQDREAIINWLTQTRKHFWDIILVAQAPEMLDKQVRGAVCEAVARLRRLDRVKVCGFKLFPRVHIGIVRYGMDQNAPIIERWFYQGKDAHKCFASHRLFGSDSAHYSVLPATLSKWRYRPAWCAPWWFRFLVSVPVAVWSIFCPLPTGKPANKRRTAAAG